MPVTNSREFTIEVEVATYLLDMYTWDTVKEEYIACRFKVDGVLYEDPTRVRIPDLPAGRHTIEMVKPGYVFEKWFSASDGWVEVEFDDPYANPTVATTRGMGFIYCYVHRPPPDLKIVTLDYPPSAKPGDPVNITWRVHNQGQDSAFPQWFRIVDLDTGEELNRLDFGLGYCAGIGLTWTFTMPDRAWRLRAEAGYEEVVTAAIEFSVGLPVPTLKWLMVLAPLILGAVTSAISAKKVK